MQEMHQHACPQLPYAVQLGRSVVYVLGQQRMLVLLCVWVLPHRAAGWAGQRMQVPLVDHTLPPMLQAMAPS
jgi:hypothetical protein